MATDSDFVSTCVLFRGSQVYLWHFYVYGFSCRGQQGSREGVKITTVELANMTDSDSKEEQDTTTSVDNICYERVPSKCIN